ncbi:MAG: hypothetical protein RBS55_13930, partial [Bacteroidales bacterium]|nr:hypothetical protein [Bacteroidales bacterium]
IHTMKKDTLENRLNLARLKAKIPDDKLLMGSVIKKYPVVLDGGKTVIYISDKTKVEETRLKYEMLKNSKAPDHYTKKQQ